MMIINSSLSTAKRFLHSSRVSCHENPLGLPRQSTAAPTIPRRSGPPVKRNIPNAKKIVVVASGKGGVGKSTIATNLAVALALNSNNSRRRLRIGLLDLDLFGPSIPKLMGLESNDEPELTSVGALIPLKNHGIPCMSMGFLLPRTRASESSEPSRDDTPVVWRGLMVQKAVQQLLFDVDWRAQAGRDHEPGDGLDVLVVDMPPGTGDVPLTVGQLVNVDAAVIVSTPQDVSMSDVRKGIAMFRKVSIPITGIVLNTSYFKCSTCSTPHHLFGDSESFRRATAQLGVAVLGELPLVPQVSMDGDDGVPFMLNSLEQDTAEEWRNSMMDVSSSVLSSLGMSD